MRHTFQNESKNSLKQPLNETPIGTVLDTHTVDAIGAWLCVISCIYAKNSVL